MTGSKPSRVSRMVLQKLGVVEAGWEVEVVFYLDFQGMTTMFL